MLPRMGQQQVLGLCSPEPPLYYPGAQVPRDLEHRRE